MSSSPLFSDTAVVFQRCLRGTLRSKTNLLFGMLQPLLFLLLFGPLLRHLPLATDADTWQVLVPGLLIQLALLGGGYVGLGTVLEKRLGVVDRMRVTPVSRLALVLGRVLRDVLQLTVQSALLVALGYAMGLRAPLLGLLLGFAFVAVLSAGLAALSYGCGMATDSVPAFSAIVNTTMMPMMLLSGVLLPMSLAPGWLDGLSRVVPFRYTVEAVRDAFLGHYATGSLALGAGVSLLFTGVAMTIGVLAFSAED